jgi:hypothetical protein
VKPFVFTGRSATFVATLPVSNNLKDYTIVSVLFPECRGKVFVDLAQQHFAVSNTLTEVRPSFNEIP